MGCDDDGEKPRKQAGPARKPQATCHHLGLCVLSFSFFLLFLSLSTFLSPLFLLFLSLSSYLRFCVSLPLPYSLSFSLPLSFSLCLFLSSFSFFPSVLSSPSPPFCNKRLPGVHSVPSPMDSTEVKETHHRWPLEAPNSQGSSKE